MFSNGNRSADKASERSAELTLVLSQIKLPSTWIRLDTMKKFNFK